MAVNQSALALREAGLTLRQFAVLVAVTENEGVSQSQLVDQTGIDRSTLAEMVRRMEASGLVKRADSSLDGRAKSVKSMAKGRRALEKTRKAVEAADARLMDTVPKNRRSSFLAVLAMLADPVEGAPTSDVEEKVAPPAADKPAGKSEKKVVRAKVKATKADKVTKSGKKKDGAKKKKKKAASS